MKRIYTELKRPLGWKCQSWSFLWDWRRSTFWEELQTLEIIRHNHQITKHLWNNMFYTNLIWCFERVSSWRKLSCWGCVIINRFGFILFISFGFDEKLKIHKLLFRCLLCVFKHCSHFNSLTPLLSCTHRWPCQCLQPANEPSRASWTSCRAYLSGELCLGALQPVRHRKSELSNQITAEVTIICRQVLVKYSHFWSLWWRNSTTPDYDWSPGVKKCQIKHGALVHA